MAVSSSWRPVGRLLLTGFPGWLADALLIDLRRDPLPGLRRIRCLVQPGVTVEPSVAQRGAPFEIELYRGDLRDPAALAEAVRGIDTVFHSAGVVHCRRVGDWYDVNTAGTRRLIDAAAAAGAERFVLVSSNAAAGRAERFDQRLTEDDPPCPLSHYGRSKWLAEQEVHARADRIETVVLRPCMFYGPPVPPRHVEIYRRILAGRMPLVGGGQFARSLSHIDNLVQGSRLAMVHPAAPGQTYYITDRPIYTTRQIVEAMAEALGCAPRYLPLPRVVGPIAYGVDVTVSLLGFYWQTVHLVGESDWHVGVSCGKAERELGYAPRVELSEGMRQAIAWCRSRGLLDPPVERRAA